MPNPRKAADRERKQRKRKHGMRVSGASMKKWERIEIPLWVLAWGNLPKGTRLGPWKKVDEH